MGTNSTNETLTFFLGVAYIIGILLVYREQIPQEPAILANSPLIDKYNASTMIRLRAKIVIKDFETSMRSNNWITLRSMDNILIETSRPSDGSWPSYIRTIAIVNTKPQDLFQLFSWDNFHTTQQILDPFYETVDLLLQPKNNLRVIRKTTKRPFLLSRREFCLAMIETKQKSDFVYGNSTHPNSMRIPSGTLTHALVNVKYVDSSAMAKDSDGRIQAYQDLITWFVPEGAAQTKLIMNTRLDLGRDVPEWLYSSSLRVTGINSMVALQNMARSALMEGDSVFAENVKASLQ